MNIKNKHFLITGGAGFIGSHIANELIRQKAYVTIYDDFSRGSINNLTKTKRLKIVKGTITDKKKLLKLTKGCDAIFHQAALHQKGCDVNSEKCINVNIKGSYIVFSAAIKNKIERVVVASSSSIYGQTTDKHTIETSPANPINFYGTSKAAMEQIAYSLQNNQYTSFTILRYLNVYGPKQHITSSYTNVINHFFKKIHNDEQPVIYGGRSSTLDLIYIDDVVAANIKALQKKAKNQTYNIGTGKQTSLHNLTIIINKVVGKHIKPIFKRSTEKIIKHRTVSVTKARTQLGFNYRTSITDGIKKTIAWYTNNSFN